MQEALANSHFISLQNMDCHFNFFICNGGDNYILVEYFLSPDHIISDWVSILVGLE